jgi:hydrogenase-4 component B
MMVATEVLLLFFAVLGVAMVVVLLAPRKSVPTLIAIFGGIASLLLAAVGIVILASGQRVDFVLWSLPQIGLLRISIDSLSALFIITAALVFLPVSIFTAGYARHYEHRYSLNAMGAYYQVMLAAVVLILCSGSVVLFLLSWELMTIAAYFLVNFEHEHENTRSAAYLFLAMSEAGMIAIVVAFLVLAGGSAGASSLDFEALRTPAVQLGAGARWAVFLLSFFGFGVKAGILPVNAWLPRVYTAAPANTAAILSAVLLNMGLYGILRVNGDLLPVSLVGPGIVVLAVGAITALVGILYATIESDLRVMLAHSSIENIGIVVCGFGAAFIFGALGRPELAAMLLVAALYHMVNHSVYKSLLFMAAGSVDEATGTKDLDRLGGLARWMPVTSVFFLIGALSIAAIPPFNGFTSEWLTLQGILRSAELASRGVKIVFVLAGVCLALTAALAVTCFIKAFGMCFLGMPRTPAVKKARERKTLTVFSLGIPALLCVVLGIFPTYVIPVIGRVVQPLVGGASATGQLVPPFFSASPAHQELPEKFVAEFHDIGAQIGQEALPGRGLVLLHRGGADQHVVFAMSPTYTVVILLVLLGGTFLGIRLATRRRARHVARRWDGGLHHLLPEMTYTASGFSNPVRIIFRSIFRPRVEDIHEIEREHFRASIQRSFEEVHVVNRFFLNPLSRFARMLSSQIARIHNGRINSYAAYVLIALLAFVLIAWLAGG